MASWRNDLKSMEQRMEAILDKEIKDISHDVTFIVGEEKAKMSCHKLVLMAASPVFEAMFSERHGSQTVSSGSEITHSNSPIKTLTNNQLNQLPESERLTIRIADVMPVGLKNLIKYAYNHILNVDVKDASVTMYAAHKYDVKELIKHCEERLHSNMSVENVVTCYQAASLLNDKELEKNSWEYIQLNARELLKSQEFLEFSEDNLCKFLSLDEMPTVESEVDVFIAMLKWGSNQCEIEKKTASKENMRVTLKKIIPLIRFPTMGHLEFFDIVEPSAMLSESECYKLCMYFLFSGERRLSVAKTMDYSFKKRNCHKFVFCPTTPTDTFNVVTSIHQDSFLVAGNTENLKLKAVGIVLPQMYTQLPDVTIVLTTSKPHNYYTTTTQTVARKTMWKHLQIFYVDFDTPVSIIPDLEYQIYVNMDVPDNSAEPHVNFVQYSRNLMELPTRTWSTVDKRQLTLKFRPYSYVIWALQFQNEITC